MEPYLAEQHTVERQAKWLFDNIFRPGVRIAFIYDDPKLKDQKKAFGLAECVKDNEFFRNLLLAHCQGSPASAEVRYIEKHSTFHKKVDVCRLGAYFGGDTDLGNNVVLTYALDCDRSDALQRFIDSLPPDESKDEKWRDQPGVTALLENETKRLREMMQEAVAAFPGAMFFARPDNGKWHMHGGLRETRPACAVKAWATARLPHSCSHIEVFPKNSDGELEDGKWFNGNLIRAPFGPSMKYNPVGELRDIVPDSVEDVPTFEELAATAGHSFSSTNGKVGRPVTELSLDARIASVRNYAADIGDVSEGHRHNKTYKLAAEAVRDNGLPPDVAEVLVREFNDNQCYPPLDDSVIRNQVKDAARYAKHTVRRIPENSIEFVAPELPQESATMPAAPGDDELREIYRGSAWGTWMEEIHKVSADINPMFCLTSALTLQSVLMTPCVLVRGRKPNAYGMLVGHPSRGKGTNTTALEDVLNIMQRDLIDISSTKSLLKRGIGPNPWGCQIINEFEQFLKQNYFLNDSMKMLIDLYDSRTVSQTSETTGRAKVSGAAPSMLACIQPDRMIDSSVANIFKSGFFARTVLAVDDYEPPPFCTLPPPSDYSCANAAPIAAAFRSAYSWLPKPMKPAFEETVGEADKAKGTGVWVHPVAQVNMRVEKFESLWQKHTIPSALKPSMTRLQANVLPLLAIPFVPFEALKVGVITAEAQARAERVLLKYYWNLANLLRIAPETDGEKLVRQLLDKITRSPGISRRDLQRACAHCRPKDFDDAITVLVNRSLVTFKETESRNKQRSIHYWVNERKPNILPPLKDGYQAPAMPQKIESVEPEALVPEPPVPEPEFGFSESRESRSIWLPNEALEI